MSNQDLREKNGQYAVGLDAVCVCGCTKGQHLAGRDSRSVYECNNCTDCEKFRKFRKSRKNAPKAPLEDYVQAQNLTLGRRVSPSLAKITRLEEHPTNPGWMMVTLTLPTFSNERSYKKDEFLALVPLAPATET